jgi:glutamate-1-semialdehyde 2,1-aminomutase
MLLSKRPEMFLPENWPNYFSKANGVNVWDLDGNKYVDMLMTPGTNSLGYNHPKVNEAVEKAIRDGNMSSLNAPEEVELAGRLIDLHPWADMAKFARSGGEANAIAIRIARAASGKDNVAICGYHGWHDWYLATNLNSGDGLKNHLLPGLEANGVPKNLADTIFPFEYNDIDHLEFLLKSQKIGVIKMEVFRNKPPINDFLIRVRELASKYKAILIFDECTSGFRKTYGGLHKLYGVEPDMAMFGKALGNGYAITAVIGRRSVMESAQCTFISSTFWTERIGSVAGLATLDAMEREKSWESITNIGKYIQDQLSSISEACNIPLKISGLEALTTYAFDCGSKALQYKTFITQEMLKRGYLAGSSFYPSNVHTKDTVDRFFSNLLPIFKTIEECLNGDDISDYLQGPVCHDGFKRLN